MIPIKEYLKDTNTNGNSITGDYSSTEGIFEYRNRFHNTIIIDELILTMSTTSANGVIDQFGSSALTNGFSILFEEREGGIISLSGSNKIKTLTDLIAITRRGNWKVYDDATNFIFSSSITLSTPMSLQYGDKIQICLTDDMSSQGLTTFTVFASGRH